MESIGILFINLICPILGIIFIIRGINNYRKTKNKKRIFIGIAFLFIPFLNFLLTRLRINHYENEIIGSYTIKGQKEVVLKLKSDKTFDLNKCDTIFKCGKGSWYIVEGDQLMLHLIQNEKPNLGVLCEILDKDTTTITYDFLAQTHIELIKIPSN